MVDKQKQGKKNRASGMAFERKVRADLESKGWIVSKWMNNVEIIKSPNQDGKQLIVPEECKCIPAKRKYNPFNRALSIGTGFPDFIAYKFQWIGFGEEWIVPNGDIQFIECKINGKLDKTEKEKAKFYLENGYCSKFLIASKKLIGRKIEVEYTEFDSGSFAGGDSE